jgi:hypothetical protein
MLKYIAYGSLPCCQGIVALYHNLHLDWPWLTITRMAASQKSWSDMLHNRNVILALLSPSWLSGIGVVVGALAIIVWAAAAFYLPGSELHILLQEAQPSQPELSTNTDRLQEHLAINKFMSNLPLLLLWGGVGAVVYVFTISIANAIARTSVLKAQMNYLHADKKKLVHEAIQRLVIRLLFVLVWFLLIKLSLKLLLPYSIAAVHFATGPNGWVNRIVYISLAFIVLLLTLHAHTVLIRLIGLRPRLFGQVG